MKIIEPQVELWQQGEDPIVHVAKCARVCYGNAISKGEKADNALYDSLVKAGHNSMFRHQSVYAALPFKVWSEHCDSLYLYINDPHIEMRRGVNYYLYITTNQNFMIDHNHSPIWDLIVNYEITPKEFENSDEVAWQMMRYTFHITTQISTSRELNRVSPNNIAEKSTRYVDESDGNICKPHWMTDEEMNIWNSGKFQSGNACFKYLETCQYAFNQYENLLNAGLQRQDARGVLPLDTATKCVYTYSVDEWRRIIELRTNKRAHPNAQIIANMVKKELKELGYDF